MIETGSPVSTLTLSFLEMVVSMILMKMLFVLFACLPVFEFRLVTRSDSKLRCSNLSRNETQLVARTVGLCHVQLYAIAVLSSHVIAMLISIV